MTSHKYIFGGALPLVVESWGALAPLAPPSAATDILVAIGYECTLLAGQTSGSP